MLRRLGEHLIVPEPKALHAEQARAGPGDPRVRYQRAQDRVNAKPTEEVADDLTWTLRERLLDLVEPMAVTVQIRDDLVYRRADRSDFLWSEHLERADEAVAFKRCQRHGGSLPG